MLPLKDSLWNQLGWCAFPYDGAYQSDLPVKGGEEAGRLTDRKTDGRTESEREVYMHVHLMGSAHSGTSRAVLCIAEASLFRWHTTVSLGV